jgi:hypothetical protein
VEGYNMTKTSQQHPVPEEKLATLRPFQGSATFKIAAALVFAGALALAPAPAFAQHGGGGGGGHAGGGGGASHGGGGFGGGAASAPSGGSGGGSHASGGGSASGNNNSGGHSWNPFHSSASKPATTGANSMPAGNIKSEGNAANPGRFASANNTWQDPPKPATSGRVNYYSPANVNASRPYVPLPTNTRAAVATRGATVASAQHPFQPIHPGSPYSYYPYYPYFYYPGFGYYPYYGGLGFGFGAFGGCNPYYGCNGFGFGYGFGGYGYGGGAGYYGVAAGGSGDQGWTDESSEGSSNVTSPDNPSSYVVSANGSADAQMPGSDAAPTQPADAASQQPTYVLLYLKDGSSFAVSDYWLTGGKLHYITSYGGENSIDESQVDLQRTVNENATRGVTVILRTRPAGTTGDAPAAAPAQAPDTPKLQK